jgi:RNA polymerase sigma-70 factor (ECF subfamily)
MGRLDVDKRAILVLHHVEDRPIKEIAAVLGIPNGTVKWRLHAARAALQRAFEEESR